MRSHSVFFAFGFLVLLAACSPAPQPQVSAPQLDPSIVATMVTVTEADDGGRVALSVSDTLAVVLLSNSSTGYSWEVVSNLQDILVSAENVQLDSTSARLGAVGEELFLFNAIGPGEAELRLAYRRPFEQAQPAKVFEVHVSVKRQE